MGVTALSVLVAPFLLFLAIDSAQGLYYPQRCEARRQARQTTIVTSPSAATQRSSLSLRGELLSNQQGMNGRDDRPSVITHDNNEDGLLVAILNTLPEDRTVVYASKQALDRFIRSFTIASPPAMLQTTTAKNSVKRQQENGSNYGGSSSSSNKSSKTLLAQEIARKALRAASLFKRVLEEDNRDSTSTNLLSAKRKKNYKNSHKTRNSRQTLERYAAQLFTFCSEEFYTAAGSTPLIQYSDESPIASCDDAQVVVEVAVGAIFAVLALGDEQNEQSRAVASAMESAVQKLMNSPKTSAQMNRIVADGWIQNLLKLSLAHEYTDNNNDNTKKDTPEQQRVSVKDTCHARIVDMHIVTAMARCFDLDQNSASHETMRVTNAVIRERFQLHGDTYDDMDTSIGSIAGLIMDNHGIINNGELSKRKAASTLALAAQIGPWNLLPPFLMVQISLSLDLSKAAERTCMSATTTQTLSNNNDDDAENNSVSAAGIKAVHTLIDGAIHDKCYRNADTYATMFYEVGGQSRYAEARFLHACATMSKLVKKRALAVIERQVGRVDEAIKKVGYTDEKTISMREKVRAFALRRLEDGGDIETAHRLATTWGIEFVYDEEKIQAAALRRQKEYLQWHDVLQGDVPDLASTPEQLERSFAQLLQPTTNGDKDPMVVGFDVEWGDDGPGASLLQIASDTFAVLIDIPALTSTERGIQALRKTVGNLFSSQSYIVVGFGCPQDISRLRSSPGGLKNSTRTSDIHWLGSVGAVVDLQHLISRDQPALRGLGLSRCCQHYFGKPLDKSEQCSFWDARPLTEAQRIYAALDAFACAAIFKMIV